MQKNLQLTHSVVDAATKTVDVGSDLAVSETQGAMVKSTAEQVQGLQTQLAAGEITQSQFDHRSSAINRLTGSIPLAFVSSFRALKIPIVKVKLNCEVGVLLELCSSECIPYSSRVVP